jgi:hypothetical protein
LYDKKPILETYKYKNNLSVKMKRKKCTYFFYKQKKCTY